MKVSRPRGLKTRPAWVRKDCCSRQVGWLGHHAGTRPSVAASRTALCGVRIRAELEPADEDDLIPGPDSDGEGAGAVAKSSVGAIVGPI
jgi:hypothetical protein